MLDPDPDEFLIRIRIHKTRIPDPDPGRSLVGKDFPSIFQLIQYPICLNFIINPNR